MRFAEIPGLEEVKKVLVASVQNNHVAHAQLFLSQEGNANMALALAYATYINCTDRQGDDSCGKCASCNKYDKLIHPDLNFIVPVTTNKKITKSADAVTQNFLPDLRSFLTENRYPTLKEWSNFIGTENKQCNISKEESRNIVKMLSLRAYEAEYKVMLVWLPELMHPAAANALLKILEEPPKKTLFLMVCNDADALLVTILSRTQLVKVRNFSDTEIKTLLTEQYGASTEKAASAAQIAEGNAAEAIRLSAEVKDEASEIFKAWMRYCFKSDFAAMLEGAEAFNMLSKETQKSLMQYAMSVMRESLIWKATDGALNRLEDTELQFVKNFSRVLNEDDLAQLAHYFEKAYIHIERNANAKILFTDLSIRIAAVLRKR